MKKNYSMGVTTYVVHTEGHKVTARAHSVPEAEMIAARILGGVCDVEMRHVDCDCCVEAVGGIRLPTGFEAFLGTFPQQCRSPDMGEAHYDVAGVLV